jgi:hypothetical protein
MKKTFLVIFTVLLLTMVSFSATIILEDGMYFIGEIEEENEENIVAIIDGFRYQIDRDDIFQISEKDLTVEEINALLNPSEPEEKSEVVQQKPKVEPQLIPQELIDDLKRRGLERRTTAIAVDPLALLLNKHVKIDLLTFSNGLDNGGWMHEFEVYDDEFSSTHVKHAFYRIGVFYSFENIFEGIMIKALVGMGRDNLIALDVEETTNNVDPDSQHVIFSLKPGISYYYLINNRFIVNGGLEYHFNWVAEPTAQLPETITGLKLDVNIGVAF